MCLGNYSNFFKVDAGKAGNAIFIFLSVYWIAFKFELTARDREESIEKISVGSCLKK